MVQLQERHHGAAPVDQLQAYGISSSDVNKLKDAGLCTIESVVFSPRKVLLQIKGLSEAMVDKIIDAASILMPGTASTSQPRAQRLEIIQITSGSREHENILEGAMEMGSITEVYGEFPSGKTQLCSHPLCGTCQLPLNQGGGEGKALYIGAKGTILPELPTDIWSNILLLAELPLKTLVNLSTNKSWKLAITSAWFVKRYKQNGSGKDRELIIQGYRVWEFYVYTLESNTWREIEFPREVLKKQILIVGACRGLLLVMVPLNNSTLYLWNPSLRRVRDLIVPPGLGKMKGDVVTMGFGLGFRAEVNEYEVICIRSAENELNEVQLFNISSNTWRSLFLAADDPLHFRSSYGFYLGNSLYWCLDHYDGVLEFNMDYESLRILLSPARKIEEEEILGMHVGEFQNELAVFVHHRQVLTRGILDFSIFIFVLREDDGGDPWILQNTLCAQPPQIIGRPLSRNVLYYTGVYDVDIEEYYFVLLDTEDFAMDIYEEFVTEMMVMVGNDGELYVDEYTENLQLL